MISKIIRLGIVGYIYRFFSRINSFIFERLLSSIRFRALIKKSGTKSYCHYTVEIKYGENITIGNSTRIGPKSTLGALGSIEIGSNVVVSKQVIIETAGLDFKSKSVPYKHVGKKIIIEDNVWIGAGAIILGGVHLGKNALIGAGTVVSKDVPADHILVGQQPRLIFKKH